MSTGHSHEPFTISRSPGHGRPCRLSDFPGGLSITCRMLICHVRCRGAGTGTVKGQFIRNLHTVEFRPQGSLTGRGYVQPNLNTRSLWHLHCTYRLTTRVHIESQPPIFLGGPLRIIINKFVLRPASAQFSLRLHILFTPRHNK